MDAILSHRTAYRFWTELFRGDAAEVAARIACAHPDVSAAFGARQLPPSYAKLTGALSGSPVVDVLSLSTVKRGRCERIRFHSWARPLPEGALCQVGEGLYVTSPAFTLALLGYRSSMQELAAFAHVLCAGYRLDERAPGGVFARAPLTDAASLRHALGPIADIPGAGKALRALRRVSEGCASPREAAISLLYFSPRELGGEGIVRPRCNYRVDFDELSSRVCGRGYAVLDFAWPERRVALEYDGLEWHTGMRTMADDNRRNALRTCGYTVLVATKDTLSTREKRDAMARQLERLVYAQKRRVKPVDEAARAELLRAALTIPSGRFA